MAELLQLILDVGGYAIALPESRKGGYEAYEEDLTVDLTMIPGNMVKEVRGSVWHVNYQYGWFNDTDKNRVIAACVKGRKEPILCAFLPPNGDELITSEFFVTTFNFPKFQWSRIVTEDGTEKTVPLWADFSVELREVDPHD